MPEQNYPQSRNRTPVQDQYSVQAQPVGYRPEDAGWEQNPARPPQHMHRRPQYPYDPDDRQWNGSVQRPDLRTGAVRTGQTSYHPVNAPVNAQPYAPYPAQNTQYPRGPEYQTGNGPTAQAAAGGNPLRYQQSAGMPVYGSTGANAQVNGRTGGSPVMNGQTGPMPRRSGAQGTENGEAPELVYQRSSNVYDRKGDFWARPEKAEENQSAGKQSTGRQEQVPAEHCRPNDPPKEKVDVRGAIAVLFVFLIGIAICYYVVFRVRDIQVTGNTTYTAEEIIRLSGISEGDSIFSVNTEKMQEFIARNRYLVVEKVWKSYPSHVSIAVHERTAAAVMNYCGINYTIDNKGMVLEESEMVADTGGMILVSGMEIANQSGCSVGHYLVPTDSRQLESLSILLIELKVCGATDIITKIVVSDVNDLLMHTVDGYSVRLGTVDNAVKTGAKIKALMAVRDKLNEMQTGTGTIDVRTETNPGFTPETSLETESTTDV